jgi:hypothetical protein
MRRGGDMADSTDILLEYWKDQRTQARNTESQRATLTNIILLIVVATLGFIGQQGLREAMLPLTISLIVLGLFGAAASAKYYERYRLHIAQAVQFSRLLGDPALLPDYEDTLDGVRAAHAERYRWTSKIRLNKMWIALHLLVALTGLVLTAIVLS